jgi:MFS family permease
MLIALVGFIVLASNQNVVLLFIFALGLGIANAGIRIQRITYLFNHIPNNIIGRTNSVFQSINIFLRAVFLGVFSVPFFSQGSNIIWAFVIASIAVFISLFPLLLNYKQLRELKTT